MNCHSSDSLYAVFSQVIRFHFHRALTLLEKEGVYPGQPPLLFALIHKDGQSQRELADKLGIKPATITVMLRRIEKAGLVERKADEVDQRISRVFLTEKGKEACTRLKEVMSKIDAECFSNFTQEEQDILLRLLLQLRDNLMKASGKKLDV